MFTVAKVCFYHAETISNMIRESFKEQADLLGLKEEDYPSYAAFDTPVQVRGRIERGNTVLMGLLNGTPAGTVGFYVIPDNPDKGFISRLCVLPRFRGRGIGVKLMNAAEGQLALLGASTSEISIAAQFTRLEKYYKGLGYLPRDKKNVPSLPFPVLYMKKILTSDSNMGTPL